MHCASEIPAIVLHHIGYGVKALYISLRVNLSKVEAAKSKEMTEVTSREQRSASIDWLTQLSHVALR